MASDILDGFGRHKSALWDHSDGKNISPLLVVDRSSNARSEALKYFFTARDEDDFYFEDILNSFIALAQYPINFAVFKEAKHDNAHPEFWTHFCSDKAQEAALLRTFRGSNRNWNMLSKDSMFRLFPDLLYMPSFYVVIFSFSPKTNIFQIVQPGSSRFPLSKDQQNREKFDPYIRSITTPMEYLASCADHFFQFMWDAFDTDFRPLGTKYLKSSLEKLKKGQVKWMDRQRQLQHELKETVFPDPGSDRWVDTLRTTFSSVLNDATDGVDLVTAMMRDHRTEGQFAKGHPPNMFLAYRVFDREPTEARNRVGSRNLGYLYNSSFLIPEVLHSNFKSLLEKLLEDRKLACSEVSMKRYGSFEEAFSAGGRRCAFSQIRVDEAVHEGRAESVSRTLKVLDEDFWALLESQSGIEDCIEILGSKIGSKIRSLADSVYNTGLIYTNHLFRDGGVDRLGDLKLVDIKSVSDIPESCQNDVRRVVLFYYVFGELLGWVADGETFDPDRVAAVLTPVKMRGSVWGVVMHAVYTPDYDDFFADQRYWQGYFKLTTDLSAKNRQVFDRFMWGLADEMVTEKLIKLVDQCLSRRDADYVGAAEDLNYALRGMERKTPFALPEFEFTTEQPESGSNYLRFPPGSDASIWLCWKIRDNALFSARQPWSLNATRNFERIVRHGVLTGMNQISGNGLRRV